MNKSDEFLLKYYPNVITNINDIERLNTLSRKAIKKTELRMFEIKTRINKSMSKNCLLKKYYIKNKYEYNELLKYVESINNAYTLSLHTDTINLINKVVAIEPSFNSRCCPECDDNMIFINKKIPSIYCMLCKK
jgi:hypothetical protein